MSNFLRQASGRLFNCDLQRFIIRSFMSRRLNTSKKGREGRRDYFSFQAMIPGQVYSIALPQSNLRTVQPCNLTFSSYRKAGPITIRRSMINSTRFPIREFHAWVLQSHAESRERLQKFTLRYTSFPLSFQWNGYMYKQWG